MGAELNIDLQRFADNLAVIKRRVAPAEVMLVVKNDAYGHGVSRIAERAVAAGIGSFGTFDAATALTVREVVGPKPRIFAWNVEDESAVAQALRANIELGVGNLDYLELVAQAATTAGVVARVHLKIDTGLHRNGFLAEQWPLALDRALLHSLAGAVRVVGVWSHLAETSDPDDDDARAVFDGAVNLANEAGFERLTRHLTASAASFARPEFEYDAVRIGAFAYGVRSVDGLSLAGMGIGAIATLTAEVTNIEPDAVTVGIGSFDGLPSTLAGKLTVATPHGPKRVTEISGYSSSVSPWPGAQIGDTVTVFGPGAGSATDLAERIDTVGEEILVRLTPHVRRTYR